MLDDNHDMKTKIKKEERFLYLPTNQVLVVVQMVLLSQVQELEA